MFTILSALDQRARPKGSRDPLGHEAIWTFLGRQVVGNLTTVTASLDNFMVALWCCQYANAESNDIKTVQTAFKRAEQLAAYLKLSAGADGFLGITRAKEKWQTGSVNLGDGDAEILSLQLSYGLWGLYSSAMRGAGLIEGPTRKPAPAGEELLRRMIAVIGPENWAELSVKAGKSSLRTRDIAGLAEAFMAMLRNEALRQEFADVLLGSQPGKSLQSELFAAATRYFDELGNQASWNVPGFLDWSAAQEVVDVRLKTVFARMVDLQPLLVLGDTLMAWLQTRGGADISVLRDDIRTRFAAVGGAAWLDEQKLPHRSYLQKLLKAAQENDPIAAIRAVCEQNRAVMLERGGAPWVEIVGEKLTVRVANENFTLPDDIVARCREWEYSFFLGAFLSVKRQGRA